MATPETPAQVADTETPETTVTPPTVEQDPKVELGKDGKPFDAARAQALIEKLQEENKQLKPKAKLAEELSAAEQKRKDALGLFIESVLKPDHELRQCAHNQKCYNELLEWREDVLEYLNSRRSQEFGA